jgi:PAS domain S-box-containing protein
MDHKTAGALLVCSAQLILAAVVILNNPRALVNRLFGLSVLTIVGWISAITFALSAQDPSTVVWLGRLGFAFASGIPFTLLCMFGAFSDEHASVRRRRVAALGLFCMLFVALSLSPWIVSGARSVDGHQNFLYGPAHGLFGFYFLVSFVFALYTLWAALRSASGLRRLQLRYLLIGIVLGGAGGTTTNLVVPLLWKSSAYSAFGPYFTLLMVSFSAHAIIRHRLMDIRVVIRKGVVYVSAMVAAVSVFLILVNVAERLSLFDTERISLTAAIVFAGIAALLFQPFKGWLERSFNRYVYRESYDYQRTIREASTRLSRMLDLQSLLDYLNGTTEQIFKAEAVTLYLYDSRERCYVARRGLKSPHWATANAAHSIPEEAAIVRLVQQTRRPVIHEEAIRHPNNGLYESAALDLRGLGGAIAFPLIDEHSLAGLLVVGPKRSGDPYFSEDIDLLFTLVGQAAVAIKNAHLYREVVLVNEFVDNILSTMASGVIAVDASGHISLSNPAAEHLTGMSLKRRQNASYTELPIALVGPLRGTLAEGKAYSQLETSIHTKEGLTVPLVYSTAPLKDKDGSTHGALIVFSDLSRLKELELEKQRAERLASVGSLASGVAHEIKNPLVAIRTFAELLPERFADVDFRDDFSKVVVREIDRIDNLVARLRGMASAPQPQTSSVDVRQPMSETLQLLRGQLEHSRTTVRYAIEDNAPFVTIDDSQLKQLFLNLFQNAIEAMGSGGEISIRIARSQLPGPSWILIEISDTGPGMSDSVRSHVFEPFFTTKPRGSGLGLAICRSIVDAHKGSIRAENNRVPPGTTIVVELPAADADAAALQSAVRG